MPSVADASAGASNPLNAALRAGLEVISQSGTVTFTRYHRLVLPMDGFVFWVRADILTASAIYNTTALNAQAFNRPRAILRPAAQLVAQGSLHWATVNRQDQDEGFSLNEIVFTSEQEVEDLNEVSPQVMFMATVDGRRFSFSKRSSFYRQAGIYHYHGDAVYPVMDTQIIDNPAGFDSRNVVVSNSLPLWLALNAFCPVYPSFLVDSNVSPPYASVHIGDTDTEALQSAPLITADSSHYQLVQDDVLVTLYGLRNFNAVDFLDYVLDYSVNGGLFGIMNMPVVRDAKRTQAEMGTLAMKKNIAFQVNYYQTRMRDVARQLITSCILSTSIDGGQTFMPPSSAVTYSENFALPYTGPFMAAQVMPRVIFMQTTTLTRGVAYTASTGTGVFSFYRTDTNGDPGELVFTVTCEAGNHYPQIDFPNGPQTFYINEVLTPVAPAMADAGLTDLTITFGSNPQ